MRPATVIPCRGLRSRVGTSKSPRSGSIEEALAQACTTALSFWTRLSCSSARCAWLLGASMFTWTLLHASDGTLTVAVGSLDGDARQAATVMAGQLATTNSTVRLEIDEPSARVLDAAKTLAAGNGRSRGDPAAMCRQFLPGAVGGLLMGQGRGDAAAPPARASPPSRS